MLCQDNETETQDYSVWKRAANKSFVLSAGMLYSISMGVMLAFPSVLNPSLLSLNNSDISATRDQVSSIASCNGLAGIIGFFILPPIMQIFGRKIVYIFINVTLAIGWIVTFFSNSVISLYVARSIQGVVIGGVFINSILVSEYSHPKRRGYFISIKKASIAFGCLLCHSMTLVWSWRQIAAYAIVPLFFATIITCFWPESPSFLAMKGHFVDCEKSFFWLNGNSLKSQNQLKDLISAQKEVSKKKQNKKITRELLKVFWRKDFLKPFIMITLLIFVVDACGKHYLVAYFIQIMGELTDDKSVAVYCTIGADCLTILALFLSIFVIRLIKIRSLLFTFGGFSVFLMFMISIIEVLKRKLIFLLHLPWLNPCIVLLHSFIINLSVIPACYVLYGELFPLEHRGIGFCASGIVLSCFYAIILKVTPMLMENTGLEGVYSTYGCFLVVCFVLLYFILPETKNKTLQEIENEIKGAAKPTMETEHILIADCSTYPQLNVHRFK